MGTTVLAGDPSGLHVDIKEVECIANAPPDPDGPSGLPSRTLRGLQARMWGLSAEVAALNQDRELRPKVVEAHKQEKKIGFRDFVQAASPPIAKALERSEGDLWTLYSRHRPNPGDAATAIRSQEIRTRFFAPDANRPELLASGEPDLLGAILEAPRGVYPNPPTDAERRDMVIAYLGKVAGGEFLLWGSRQAALEDTARALRVAGRWIREETPGLFDQRIEDIASGKVTA